MSISAPRVRLMERPLDGIAEEDITLALSTRSLKTSYNGPCVQVRRDPPENALVFVSKVDGIYNDRLESVVVSGSGDVYAVGFQYAATFYNAQGTSTLVGPNFNTTPFIAKYQNGTPVWIAGIEAFTSPTNSGGRIADLDGNVFVSAYVSRNATSLPVYSSSGVATSLPWSTTRITGSPIAKYTSDGDVAWAASVRSEGCNVTTRGIASDGAAGAYVCGSSGSGSASDIVLYDSAGVAGATFNVVGSSAWLGRYNATGNVLWATWISGASECSLSGVTPDGSGGVVACGDITVASGTTANVLHANGAIFSTFTSTNRSALVVKYDASGTALAAWKPTGFFTVRSGFRIASDGTGNVYLAGGLNGINIYHSNNVLAGQVMGTGVTSCIVKYNSDLKAVWWTSVDGAQTDGASSVAADVNGVYMTGSYATTAGGTANIYHANTAVAGVLPATTNGGGFFIRYDPTGNVMSWNSTSSGSFEGIALDPVRNRALLAGYVGGNANILNQSGIVISSVTGTGEAGFLGSFQLGATTKDIGFKGRSLDTLALQNHCRPGSNGYVQTWYSQSLPLETPLIEEYPPAPMTADTTTLAGQAYGDGTYVANASSVNNSSGLRAFDRNPAVYWASALFYTGGIALYTTAIVDGVGVPGEWLELKLPYPIALKGYGIMPRSESYLTRAPMDFVVAGSHDGTVWAQVDTRTDQTGYVANTLKQFTLTSSTPYQYYRIIVSRIGAGGQSTVNIGEWRLYSNYSDRNARQYLTQNQPLLIQNGIVNTSSTNRPLMDFSSGKSLVVPYDSSAAGTPTYIANTSGLAQSTYATTITSGEVIGTRTATPTLTENQQFAYGSTPNTLSSARLRIGSVPILDTLSQNAQTSCLAAFSFRKLLQAYKGPVVRLRRESDNVERDFYGSPSAIETWIGASSARVVTLYDQSGNGKHASQSTATNQPQVAKQFGVYVAHFNGTVGVGNPQFMGFADIYPASFWSQYYINVLNNVYATLFAKVGGSFPEFRHFSGTMTFNTGDFLGTSTDTKPYWMINGLYGNNNQNPKSVSLQVWNRVTGSRMTSAGPINQIGRGYTPQFRDFNGFLAELVFWSKPALVQDALVLDASPLIKTTSTYLSQTLNTTIGRLGALVSRGFANVLDAVQIMSSFASTSSGPRTGSGPLILNTQNFGNFQYLVKRGTVSVSPGYAPLDYFSSVQDTAAAIMIVDNLTIGAGCIFTPPTRKLFTVLYVTGNLVLDGEISMTARGANHNATGTSGFSSVFPGKDIVVYNGEYGDLFGATNAYVPAGGGSGAVGTNQLAVGPQGGIGSAGGSAGGGAGGAGGTFVAPSGSGNAGTSFSGGTGGGGSNSSIQGGDGEPNGGLGGQDNGVGGGAGNGPNGTGGTLIVIVSGSVSGAGKVTSHGSVGSGGGGGGAFKISGGGSGGGSAWLLAGSGGDSVKVTATGGDRARERSGLGGNGSAMKISLKNPSISTSTQSSVVGAYSLRRLFNGWGGPVVRVRHGTTNEERDFYSEDLLAGAALDVFLGGAVAYIRTWYDQSGSNNHASQTTTTSQPWIVRDASWTTKPTVRCGGVGFLNYNGAGLVNTNYTVAISTARTAAASGGNAFVGGAGTSLNQVLFVGYSADTTVVHGQWINTYYMTVDGYTVPIPHIFSFRHSSTLGKNTYLNGNLLGVRNDINGLTSYIGATIGGNKTTKYQGDISEVVLLASYVPDTERSLLESSMITALGTSSGLVLHLDAQQHTSGSTTWTDISGSGYNFSINAGAYTVSGGVSYMNFGGSFGIAKRVVGGVLTEVPAFSNATFIVFTRIVNPTGTWRSLIRGTPNDTLILVLNTGDTLGFFDTPTGFKGAGYNVSTGGMVGNWSMGVWKLSSSSPYYQFSKNKDPTTYTITDPDAIFTNGFINIGGLSNPTGSTDVNAAHQYWGDIGQFMYYNRHVSQTEIDGIYDMYKGRYGLV